MAAFWNLSQAAAWVVFRDQVLTEQMKDSPATYGALLLYPPEHPKVVGSQDELRQALVEGRVGSFGFKRGSSHPEPIPAVEWDTLNLSPPCAFRSVRYGRDEPWKDIRLDSKSVRNIWRTTFQETARDRYDWSLLRRIFEEVKHGNPDLSVNELILECQAVYQERTGAQTVPGRASMQRRIKAWV